MGNNHDATSVPTRFFPGSCSCSSPKIIYPLKSKLLKLNETHFYGHGQDRTIDEDTESCAKCSSPEKIPKEVAFYNIYSGKLAFTVYL